MLLKSTSHRKNVVVVDDEVGMRRLLKAVLEPRGFVVVECVTGEEFLKYIASNPVEPSCVMLDLHRQGLLGPDEDCCAHCCSSDAKTWFGRGR